MSLPRVASRVAASAALRSNVPALRGALDVPPATARANREAMDSLVDTLRAKLNTVETGGGHVAAARHKARGKLLARERIEQLVDPGTPFLELSPLAGHEMYGKHGVAAGGVVAGVGRVEGVECMIVANDATVKGGTYYPITVKKHLRAQVRLHERVCGGGDYHTQP